MFTGMLMLHIAGAILSLFGAIYGTISALTRKGNLKQLKTSFTSLALYQVVTGVALVVLQPTTATLTTFCIGGVSLFAVFVAVYYVAAFRITPNQERSK